MGKEDALRGCVSWLVEPLYGNRLHRLVKSTHHLGAQVLAKTHCLSLAAFGEKMSLKSKQMTHPSLAPLSSGKRPMLQSAKGLLPLPLLQNRA